MAPSLCFCFGLLLLSLFTITGAQSLSLSSDEVQKAANVALSLYREYYVHGRALRLVAVIGASSQNVKHDLQYRLVVQIDVLNCTEEQLDLARQFCHIEKTGICIFGVRVSRNVLIDSICAGFEEIEEETRAPLFKIGDEVNIDPENATAELLAVRAISLHGVTASNGRLGSVKEVSYKVVEAGREYNLTVNVNLVECKEKTKPLTCVVIKEGTCKFVLTYSMEPNQPKLISSSCSQFTKVPANPKAPAPNSVGGWFRLEPENPEIIKLARLAISLYAEDTNMNVDLIRVIAAESQVVAGMNYRFTNHVQVNKCSGTVLAKKCTQLKNQVCHFALFVRAWTKTYSLKGFQCYDYVDYYE